MSDNFKRYLNFYEWETTLPGSGAKVKYKPITTGQIKRLLLYGEIDDSTSIENALDTLISECVVTEGFNIKEQYLQDRFYLMVEIRNVTKGYKYTFPSNCFMCDSQTHQTVDLSKMVVKKLNKNVTKEDVKQTVKPTSKKKGKLELIEDVTTPVVSKTVDVPWNLVNINDNISITLNILTRQMQEDIMELLKDSELTEEQKSAEMNILGYAIAIENIITPEGVETDLQFQDKVYFIENLTPMEKEKIDDWYVKNSFGLDFTFKVKCIHCGDETERVIPLDSFFY